MQMQMEKFDYEAKLNQEKRDNERRKIILILIMDYLVNMGYSSSAANLKIESGFDIDSFMVAPNMDLDLILYEFEEYFKIRHKDRAPVFILKNNNERLLPTINMKSSNNKVKHKSTIKAKKENIVKNNNDNDSNNSNTPLKLELIGQNIAQINEINNNINIKINNKNSTKDNNSKAEKTFNDQKENILLKPLPDSCNNPELKDLASLVKKEIILVDPNVHFDDIVGLEQPKKIIEEALLYPLKYPQLFTGILEPWKGILLFGPPGTGKTLLAKAVATEMGTTFFNISASTIVSKWRGESEKIIRLLFELARHYQPSTIFLDEIDSIMSSRSNEGEHEGSRRMKTELLIQLDGLTRKENERVFLLAASNLPWDLDHALLRRLEKRIVVPLPDESARLNMIKKFISNDKVKEFDYELFSKKLEGYSGSDIRLVCKESLMKGVRRAIKFLEKNCNVEKKK